jgi:hypothetical protein
VFLDAAPHVRDPLRPLNPEHARRTALGRSAARLFPFAANVAVDQAKITRGSGGIDLDLDQEHTMRKLKLSPEDLRVATFPVATEPAPVRGTVAAHGAATTTCPTFPLFECPRSAFPTCGIQC